MIEDGFLGEKVLTLLLIPALVLGIFAGVRRLVISLRTGRYDSRTGLSTTVAPPGEIDRGSRPRIYWLSILFLFGGILLGIGFTIAFTLVAFRHFGWWPF